jgi:WD40 repeat protein
MFVRSLFHCWYVLAVNIAALIIVAPVRAEFGQLLFRLTASGAAVRDYFGQRVDISGPTIIVGSNGNGSAYLFDAKTGQELFTLTAPDPGFGKAAGISGDKAVVGAATDAAYVFDVTTGQHLDTLVTFANTGLSGWTPEIDLFGNAAIIGVGWDDTAGMNAGAAYVFNMSTGQQRFKLTASDAAPGDLFGTQCCSRAVAISGNKAIVSTFGRRSAYVFDVTTGEELFKLVGGYSVDIAGNIAIVASHADNGDGTAYIYDATTGQELRKLNFPTAAEFPGVSAAIDGNTAILGARYLDTAYVFDVQTGKLLTTFTGPVGSQFGCSVAINGNTAVIGARLENDSAGAAYVFDVTREVTTPGDFNTDGTVDAADYVAWRNGLGTTYTQADYNIWRANFGRSTGAASATVLDAESPPPLGGSSPAVPEPPAAWLLLGLVLQLRIRTTRSCATGVFKNAGNVGFKRW